MAEKPDLSTDAQPTYIQRAVAALKQRTHRALSPWVRQRLGPHEAGPSPIKRPPTPLTLTNTQAMLDHAQRKQENTTVWKPDVGALNPALVQNFSQSVIQRNQAMELVGARRQSGEPAREFHDTPDLPLAGGIGATESSTITGPSIFDLGRDRLVKSGDAPMAPFSGGTPIPPMSSRSKPTTQTTQRAPKRPSPPPNARRYARVEEFQPTPKQSAEEENPETAPQNAGAAPPTPEPARVQRKKIPVTPPIAKLQPNSEITAPVAQRAPTTETARATPNPVTPPTAKPQLNSEITAPVAQRAPATETPRATPNPVTPSTPQPPATIRSAPQTSAKSQPDSKITAPVAQRTPATIRAAPQTSAKPQPDGEITAPVVQRAPATETLPSPPPPAPTTRMTANDAPSLQREVPPTPIPGAPALPAQTTPPETTRRENTAVERAAPDVSPPRSTTAQPAPHSEPSIPDDAPSIPWTKPAMPVAVKPPISTASPQTEQPDSAPRASQPIATETPAPAVSPTRLPITPLASRAEARTPVTAKPARETPPADNFEHPQLPFPAPRRTDESRPLQRQVTSAPAAPATTQPATEHPDREQMPAPAAETPALTLRHNLSRDLLARTNTHAQVALNHSPSPTAPPLTVAQLMHKPGAASPALVQRTRRYSRGAPTWTASPALYTRGPAQYIGPAPALTSLQRKAQEATADDSLTFTPATARSQYERRITAGADAGLPLFNLPRATHPGSAVSPTAQRTTAQTKSTNPALSPEETRPAMPLARPSATAPAQERTSSSTSTLAKTIQRTPLEADDTLSAQSAPISQHAPEEEEEEFTPISLPQLARRIYPIIKRLLDIERERMPRGAK